MPVIVQSADGFGRAQSTLNKYGTTSAKLGIVDAAAGEIVAGDLPQLAATPGLVITPDQSVLFDAKPDPKAKRPKGKPRATPAGFSWGEDWPAAVGVDQLWPGLASLQGARSKGSDSMPSIAFVDSGIDASRTDFGGRVLAPARPDLNREQLNRRRQRPRDARRGPAAGSAPGHAGAAPTAGIVSLDVMDDQGMARTSDVIAAAQWILKNHAVQHPRRELLAPLGEPDQLPLGPARQGGREALVRGRRRRGRLRQPGPGRPADADGLRARRTTRS